MNANNQFSWLTLKNICYLFALVFFCGVVGCTSSRPPQFTPDMMQRMQSAGDRSLQKMGAKPVSHIPSGLFGHNQNVQLNVFVLQSVAGKVTGDVDIFRTAMQGVAAGVVPGTTTPFVGFSPLLGMMSGFQREIDLEFAERAQTLLRSWQSSPHDYTLNKLKKKLSIPPKLKVNCYTWGNWDEIPEINQDFHPPLADVNISLTMNLFIQDITGKYDLSESSLQMWGMISCNVASRQVMERLHSDSQTQKPNLTDLYFTNAYGTTDAFPKSKWLSEDGLFLQQQITLLIDDLVSDVCQELNRTLE